MIIRPYRPADLHEWMRMRVALWPDELLEGDVDSADAWLSRPDAVVIVAERPDGGLAGFAELGARAYAEGCATSPVAFLEGWYVDPDARGRGVGAALVRAGEAWARAQGYRRWDRTRSWRTPIRSAPTWPSASRRWNASSSSGRRCDPRHPSTSLPTRPNPLRTI